MAALAKLSVTAAYTGAATRVLPTSGRRPHAGSTDETAPNTTEPAAADSPSDPRLNRTVAQGRVVLVISLRVMLPKATAIIAPTVGSSATAMALTAKPADR